MSTKWNLQALREYLRNADCDEDDSILKLVRSVDRSIQIFHFHAYAARDALKGIVTDGEPMKEEHFLLPLGAVGEEQQEQYAVGKLASEAHILASMHSARFMFDQFSQLINRLLLNPSIEVEKCDLYNVCNRLPEGDLKSVLTELRSSHWFPYVQGFVNTAKHRNLIDHTMTISLAGNVAGIKLGAFEYGSRQFPSYWATEVLTGALQ